MPVDYALMYKGIKDAQEAKDIEPLERLKMAIVGRPKIGKSWLAATGPGEKYFFDWDGRKASLHGKPNVVAKTYQDLNYLIPTAIREAEADLKMFEYNFKSGNPTPDTFVLDSMTHWVKAAEHELMKNSSRLQRDINFAGGKLLIPSGWDVPNGIRNHMENFIFRLYAMGNVICIFHEEPEKDKIKSTEEETVFTGQYVVHPYFLRTLLSTFNEVWRVEIKNLRYQVTVKPTAEFGASTTLRLNGDVQKANIQEIIDLHKQAVATKPN